MLTLAKVNSQIGFWSDLRLVVDVEMEVVRKGFRWSCGCSGVSDNGEHVAMVPCESHEGELAGPLKDGIPEDIRQAAIEALENAKRPRA
jgi:hypothetical protein